MSSKIIQYLNYGVFLIAISTVMTALPDLVLPISIPDKEFVLVPLLVTAYVVFMILHGFRRNLKLSLSKVYSPILLLMLLPVFTLYLFEPVRYTILPGQNIWGTLIKFYGIFIFCVYYLLNVSVTPNYFNNTLKIFWYFNYVIALVSILTFVLLWLNVIQLGAWPLPSFFGERFHIKYTLPGAVSEVYSVPFYLTVIQPYYIKPFGFFSQFGTFMGLSYEAHIATFFMTPAFFLTFYFYRLTFKTLFVRVLPFLGFFLLSSSLTNLTSMIAVGTVILVAFFTYKRMFLRLYLGLFAAMIVLSFFWVPIAGFVTTFREFFAYKVDTRSGEETLNFVSYILSPQSIAGWGVFNIPTYFSTQSYDDIGLISSLLLSLFYVQIALISLRHLLRRHYVFASIGLYIVLHAVKFPLHAIQYPYTYFIVITLVFGLMYSKSNISSLNSGKASYTLTNPLGQSRVSAFASHHSSLEGNVKKGGVRRLGNRLS